MFFLFLMLHEFSNDHKRHVDKPAYHAMYDMPVVSHPALPFCVRASFLPLVSLARELLQ